MNAGRTAYTVVTLVFTACAAACVVAGILSKDATFAIAGLTSLGVVYGPAAWQNKKESQ